jgi:hypothetical protein
LGGGVPGRCGGENVQGNYSYEKEDKCGGEKVQGNAMNMKVTLGLVHEFS